MNEKQINSKLLATIQEVDKAIRNNDIYEPAYNFTFRGLGVSISLHQLFGTKTSILMVNLLCDGKLGTYLEPKMYMKFMNLIEFSLGEFYENLNNVPSFYYAKLVPKSKTVSVKGSYEVPDTISMNSWRRHLKCQKLFIVEMDRTFQMLKELSRDNMVTMFKELGIGEIAYSIQTSTHYLRFHTNTTLF